MANPLFKAMGGGNSSQPMQFLQQFPRFMQQMRGKDPNAMLQNLVSSGKVSQQQLDAVQQQAQQMMGAFDQFKGMFCK